jgi:hypothetical protein
LFLFLFLFLFFEKEKPCLYLIETKDRLGVSEEERGETFVKTH